VLLEEIASLEERWKFMARRVFAVKVEKHRDVMYVRLMGRGDRGQLSLISHASGPIGSDAKKTAVELMEGAFKVLHASDSGNRR
jgi:hypothetical protein